MLAGKGFDNVYNLSGGIKSWKRQTAVGGVEQGLEMFTGKEGPEQTLAVAYALEGGLREFYLSMAPSVKNKEAGNLFEKLSDIETKHQDRIYAEYIRMSGKPVSREAFEKTIVGQTVEGGLTTDEYIDRFQPDLESSTDIIGLAMSIEAQALDLYLRAADRTENPQTKSILVRISDEEKAHLAQLGKLMEHI